MKALFGGFKEDLQFSPRWISGLLVLLAMMLISVVEPWVGESQLVGVRQVILLLFALAGVTWLLDAWRPWGRWGIVVLLIGAVIAADAWLRLPGMLTLLAIPTALAVIMSERYAAVAVTLGETGILIALAGHGVLAPGWSDIGIALLVVWSVFGVAYAVNNRAHQIAHWSWGYYQRALDILKETGGQRERLKQTLDELAHANRQLTLAAERMAALRAIAEEAQRTKTAFVANVSHEFRTPLNIIIGLVELMVRSPEIYSVVLSPKLRKDLETIQRNCEHLSRMINDVLDLTRMEAGRLTLYRERIDLKEIVESSVAVVLPLVEKKGLTLQVKVAEALPKVYCDSTRVKQVFLNLLSNASRFTEEGGITVEIDRRDQHVLVSVTDTGPGISPEGLEKLFEPFWQSPGQLWRDRGGSGLGLSISKQFIELHGGQMWVESQVGRGTTFYFTLPVDPPLEHVARAGHPIREDWIWREHAFRTDRVTRDARLTRPRVIVWDETGALLPQLERYYDAVEFVAVGGIEQAIQELQACPAQFILLNTLTPGTLWEQAAVIMQAAPETPVVGWSIPCEIERLANLGVLGYLIKPVTVADLEKALAAVGRRVKRVLVVDDDPDTLDVLVRLLRVCDSMIEVTTASGGKEALEALRQARPDLILLDIVMPEMDGWQVAEAIRQDEEISGVPFYFVSAQDPPGLQPRSEGCLVMYGEGLSLNKLLHCSMEIARLVLTPEQAPDPVPRQTHQVAPASPGRAQRPESAPVLPP